MAVPRKLMVAPNGATRELWRIADGGEAYELAAVLPQADVNARNEHGMTALMRASRNGCVEIVRALLAHGADPNAARNDNFTALSLAAFFGHAEIVEMLVRHGANSDVGTRFGTSPQMWARARSFGDLAQRLEKRRREEKSVSSVSATPLPTQPSAPVVTPAPVVTSAPEVAPGLVVRTLKEPPEIWDLVQEAPKNFDATSAFMTRIGSMKRGFVLAVAALVVIACAGVGAMLFMKESAPLSSAPAVTVAPAPVSPPSASGQPVETGPTETGLTETDHQIPSSSSRVVETPVSTTDTATAEVVTTAPRRSRSASRPRGALNEFNSGIESVRTISEDGGPAAAPPVIASPAADARSSADPAAKRPNAPVGSPVSSPQKTAQPKPKVIQWP